MRIDILTGFPGLFQGPLTESIIGRAVRNGKVEIHLHDLRDYTHDRHRTIDDTPYGGGAGMILKPEPIFECMDALFAERSYDEVILTTPAGLRYTQDEAKRLSLLNAVAIICGRYKGVDERVREALVTREISIGDYVLTGGELAGMVIIDTVVRLLPGVVGDGESILSDSFMENELDCGYYTRPAEYRGMKVPEVLLSGNHAEIARWRAAQSARRTLERRPDLFGERGKTT
ncbi:MAG: tRNA (guanosine(37)-N1)-methyltransferase TrmD [Bacteroidota bacterium]|nr:tRNA (guanosine(37)-N1)-methyltransferase TrmD [Bacteroidota bacterium]